MLHARFDLVDEDGALLTPVPGQVTLTVSVEIQPADPTQATHRSLPDSGLNRAPPPLDLARKANVHRYEPSHRVLVYACLPIAEGTSRSRSGPCGITV